MQKKYPKQMRLLIAMPLLLWLIQCKQQTYAQKSAPIKPNIIFILADDIGYGAIRVNGGRSYATPRIDSMARHGINFTHCEATPLCSTSRSMFLTGKQNFRNYSNWTYMNLTEKTVANMLHNAGYVTGMFGKHQLQYSVPIMKNWGWDHHVIFELTEDTMKYSRYKNPVLMEDGYRIPDSVTAKQYGDDVLTQKIFDFIKANKKKPFFVYYSMSIGHSPYCPTPDDPQFANWNPDKNISDTSFFPSMVKYMDKKVGQILDALRSSGLDKNTIVMFSGDNGIPPEIYYDTVGKTHIKGEKGTPREGGSHVPLVAYWPGHVPQGAKNDDLIDFADFLQTFAQAAQVTDLSSFGKLDGLSFYDAMLGKTHPVKDRLFLQFDHHPGFSDFRRWTRDKTYKLYDSTDKFKANLFYNIVKDESETKPIKTSALTPAEKAIKQNFRSLMDTIGTWPAAPTVINPSAGSITNTSAVVTATITSSGPFPLIDRGSTLANPNLEEPYLQFGRLHDSVAKTGKFSMTRTNLKPQTQYRFTLYAMNSSLAHSTGFALDTFYTLSNPPLLQPDSFKSTSAGSNFINLKWGNAKYSSKDAKVAGYLLAYSSGGAVQIRQKPNGLPPDSIVVNGTIVPVATSVLPKVPPVSVKVSGLTVNTTYWFKLIPYTWNGVETGTYNYLTDNALTAVITTTAGFAGRLINKDVYQVYVRRK